ncbi:MAG: hypothetical protein COZ05_04675 [Armatimonadetes bacterium CG_4_10_14_3_um_filter_59_10]|nr:MAG: hypothetical protein COZ05_04675 [Armatimonadetes bacterium CG_4_10_14_3_um_filter_59_10]
MTKDKHEKIQNTTSIHGPIYGSVHTGSGDIHIRQTNYGADENSLAMLRSELLQRLDSNSGLLVNELLEQLSSERLLEIKQLYDVIETHNVADQEIKDFLSQLHTLIVSVNHQKATSDSIPDTQKIINLVDSPNLSASHKLKLSIPIIPYLLDYETEMEVSGKMDLKKMWGWLMNKLQLN